MKIEDGFITDDGQLVWEKNASGITISRGLDLCCPTMEGAPVAYLDLLEDLLRKIQRGLPKGMSLQVQWSQFSDYQGHLLAYHQMTDQQGISRWGRRCRNERFVRYSELGEAGFLRGDRVRLYLTKSFKLGFGIGSIRKRCADLLAGSSASFDIPMQEILRMMEGIGGSAKTLDQLEIFEEIYRSFHPGVGRLSREGLRELFRSERSIFANCLGGDLVPLAQSEGCFYHAGHYHGSLALSDLPSATFSGLITNLTALPVRDVRIAVNLEGLDLAQEIEKAENIKAKLERARANSKRVRMDYDIQNAQVRVQRYMSGEVVPMKLQLMIHASDKTREGLSSKLAALNSAVTSMQSAKSWENALPTTARNYFFAGLPGAPHREESHWHLVDDNNAANLLPIAGDSYESLEGAEALYHGRKGNLHGVSAFHGSKGHASPRHCLITGKTGSGKSVFGIELLTQLDAFADFVAVIDNGYSYATFTNVLSDGACRPLALDVNGEDTLNYHDTGGSPLSPRHLSEVVAVLHLMAGQKSEEDANHLRAAVLGRCLRLFYQEWSEQWLDGLPTRREEAIQVLAKVLCFARAKKMKDDLASSFVACEECLQKQDAEPVFSEADFEAQLERIKQGEEKERLMRVSYALMSREEAPTHSDFHDWLSEHSQVAERDQGEINLLVSLLEIWRADRGIKGCLFDGVNTVDLSARVVHIELSLIQDGDDTLKTLASYIVSNKIMGEVLRRPRSQRKHVVLEELGGFLNMKGGKQIVKDFYERSRKYNCFVTSVIQQVSTLPEDLARSILGNCRQAFFFAQKEPRDTEILQEVFELSDATVAIMRSFPEPNAEEGAPLICWEDLGERSRVTPCFNLASPEMLYVADSNGKIFEERAQALAQYEDVLEGVIEETAKQVNKSKKNRVLQRE